MFGVLIESKARRQRRPGGALLSIVVHASLIAAAIALTTHGSIAGATESPPVVVPVVYQQMPDPKPVTRPESPPVGTRTYVPLERMVIVPPIDVPKTLPPITAGPVIDDPSKIFVSRGPITHDSALAGNVPSVADPSAIFVPEAVEKIATLRNAVRPLYPEMLRSAGIGGRVVVRFVVDTLGRVEGETVVVREASHARFENAVRDVLPRLRFTPAQLNGRSVRMLVEMPFEFAIAK